MSRVTFFLRLSVISFILFSTCISSKKLDPQPVVVNGMRNSVQVDDILIGGQPTESALRHFAAEGYRSILSTRDPAELKWNEKELVEELGMTFVNIPMKNPVTEITDDQVRQFDEFLSSAEHPVVLHCGSGNRISGLWAVWLVEHQNMKPDEVLKLAEKTGMKSVRRAVKNRLELE